jgi:cyclic di-GMP phosphodiesterase Gmr
MGSICGELKSVAVPHGARLPLQALDTLLDAEHGTDPASVISALQERIAFDQAVVLAISKDGVHCEAALPAALSDLPWSGGALFNEVAAGRIFTTCGPHDSEEWKRVACEFLHAAQPALYLPIRIREHRGLIILTPLWRGPGTRRSGVVQKDKQIPQFAGIVSRPGVVIL